MLRTRWRSHWDTVVSSSVDRTDPNGAYLVLGPTPVELYDLKQQNRVFRDGPVLPRVSDRHTYVPIDEATYWQIRRQYEAGAYEYQIREGSYRLQDYLDKLAVHNRRRVQQAPGSV